MTGTSQPPIGRSAIRALLEDPARAAVARAAAERVRPDMVVGFGSGRAVWASMELARRRDELAGLTVVAASSATEALARELGFSVVELDGSVLVDLVIDGADEVDPHLGLIKGHGAALLREKLVAVTARRLVIVAEASKAVDRLGRHRTLPIEVVRFAWADTRRRLLEQFDEVTLRTDGGEPVVTDEGHYLLDATLDGTTDAAAVSATLDRTVGVVEHGLFLDMADEVLLGAPDGSLEVRRRAAA